MSKSILQSEKKCFLTGRTDNLELHHVVYGRGNRKMSEKYGLKVWVWSELHGAGKDPNSIHNRPNEGYDLLLKQLAERAFNEKYSNEDFIKIFGRSYL